MIKRILLGLFIILLVMVIGAAGLFHYYSERLEPVDQAATDQYKIVEIPSGAGTETIATILYEEGLIQNDLAFRAYVRHNNLDRGFIAGQYELSPSMDVEQIVAKIQAGDIYVETVWFTIPEGYTVENMAEKLSKEGLVKPEQFLALAHKPPASVMEDFPFLQMVENPEINYLLEGYLFPDTYEINTGSGAEDIIRIMLRRMDQVLEGKEAVKIREKEYSLHEILTIASLVEREARVDHERAVIAGVIYNRLEIDQRLQIDATIQYILGETKEFLLYDDLEIPSPYNTYQNDGLPPGPIAAPGKASIEAALYPENTDYYYYNYKYDDSGEHYFSHTFQEHQENVRRAEENIQ